MDGKTKKGLWFSVVYVICIAALLTFKFEEFRRLQLNALGDFFAGAFGPLALFWLVLGYFQQGEELRLNNEALHLQAVELKNSVNQQSELVAAQKINLKNYERSLEPLVQAQVTGAGFDENRFDIDIQLKNLGEYCESVVLTMSGPPGFEKAIPLDTLMPGQSVVMTFFDVHEYEDFKLIMDYKTKSGASNRQSFSASVCQEQDGRYYDIRKHAFLN